MALRKYNRRYLLSILLTMILFIVYLNVKYFPDRIQIRREMNAQLPPTISDLQEMGIANAKQNEEEEEKLTERTELKKVTFETTLKIQEKSEKRRTFICINYNGGLGNFMFIYASAYGMARRKNMDFVVLKTNFLLKIFQLGANNLRVMENYSPCKGAHIYYGNRDCAVDKNLFRINNTLNFWLDSYMQSYKYFEPVFDELRSQFTFKEHIQKRADRILSKIKKRYLLSSNHTKQTDVTLIGIHIRRGDMVGHKFGYTVGTKEYFEKAMQWFHSKYTNIAFVVCSNEIDWGKKKLKKKHIYFVEKELREVDMAVLATCDHLISSVGSFSWWASWLSKGSVVYYFPPAKNGSLLRQEFSKDYSDYFLRKWRHF